MKTITVVIPTFERRRRLEKAVTSVLTETRVPLKLHVFDNASTDDTHEYLCEVASRDERLIYFRNGQNIGGGNNYQKALASIETEYFVPLADDDRLLPDFLFDAFQILETHQDVGAAIFAAEIRDEAGIEIGRYPSTSGEIRSGRLDPSEHLRGWMIDGHYMWSSILWRRETLEYVRAPFLHVGLPSDIDFQAQIFCEFPVYMTNKVGAVYSMHPGQAGWGFDIRSAPSWAALFKRLDQKVALSRLFEMREYFELRRSMQERYRGAWSKLPDIKLTNKEFRNIVVSAGFRLGDWDLAFSLLEQAGATSRSLGPLVSCGSQVWSLPGGTENSEQDAKEYDLGFLASVVLRFKNDRETIEFLRTKAAEMDRAEADKSSQLDRFKRRKLVRLLISLGMIRPEWLG